MELQKTNESKESTALKKILQSELSLAIQAAQFDKASRLMPTKIENVFDEPKICELIPALGVESVKRQIEFELVNLASLMSVGGNLNDAQITFIAEEFVKMFPAESIADFKICFRKGAIGGYGQIQRLDGITLREWMDKYLQEKYLVMEDKLMQEKDNLYKLPELSESEREHVSRIDVDKMLKDYEESIKAFQVRAIMPMTEEEIKEEGQERPKRKVYRYDETEAGRRLKEHHKSIFSAQEKSVRERHPEWSEQQIQSRVSELREYLLQEETKPKFCTDIGKIWAKKQKRTF